MKQLSMILLAGALTGFNISCNDTSAKETNVKSRLTTTKETADNLISFKVRGESVKTSGWNLTRFQLVNASKESLNITTSMYDDTRTIDITMNGTEPGDYAVKPGDGSGQVFYGTYFPDYASDPDNSYSFQTGSFIITSIDTGKNVLSAIFWGTVKNAKGQTIDITDGKIINGSLTPGTLIYE